MSRLLVLAVLCSGCGSPGLCMSPLAAAPMAAPSTFARGSNVTVTVTYAAGTFASAPMASGFAAELIGPGSTLAGSFAGTGTGAIVSLTVSDASTVGLVLNVPATAPAGSYVLSLAYRGSACGGAAPTFTFTVS